MAIYHSRNHGDCNLEVDAIYKYRAKELDGFRVEWSCENIGFGQCDFTFDNEYKPCVLSDGLVLEGYDDITTKSIVVESEGMASNENKEFIRAIFEAMMKKMEVVE